MYISEEEILEHISARPFRLVSEAADEMGVETYVIGGYVRDIFLNRPSKDIDIVVVGSGIELAKQVAAKLGRRAQLAVFKNFGTAQVKCGDLELEFVGARRESYSHDSRKPIVEDGTLEDDQNRRDFTINALALCLNKARYGELVDPFGGLDDMEELTIRTPLDPDITFSDDPLRMMRAIRFATQLGFFIDPPTFDAIIRNRQRPFRHAAGLLYRPAHVRRHHPQPPAYRDHFQRAHRGRIEQNRPLAQTLCRFPAPRRQRVASSDLPRALCPEGY